MENQTILKALSDDTRLKIVELLLQQNYCVRALARKIGISESAVSQHLKVLRESGLLVGVQRGHFVHYDVDRNVLHELAKEIDRLATIERKVCTQDDSDSTYAENDRCNTHKKRS